MSAGGLSGPAGRHDDEVFFAASLDPDVGPSRRFVVGMGTGCAVAALGAVMVTSTVPVPTSSDGAAQAALTTVATVVGLLALHRSVRRNWAGLTLAGSAGALLWMSAQAMAVPAADLLPGPSAALVSVGVLGGGTWLVRIGAARAGAILIGAAIGARLFGDAMRGASAGHELVFFGLALTATAAAFLLMMLVRATRQNDGLAETAGIGPGLRMTVAGCVAAGFPPLPLLLGDRIAADGLLLVVGAVCCAAVAGVRVLAGTVLLGAVTVAGVAATGWLAGASTSVLWPGAAAGVAVGCVIGVLPARRPVVAVVAGLGGLALLTLPDRFLTESLVANLVLTLLLGAVTATAAVLARRIAERSATPALVAAIVPVLTVGGTAMLPNTQVSTWSAVLLCAVAVALAGWAWLRHDRNHRARLDHAGLSSG